MSSPAEVLSLSYDEDSPEAHETDEGLKPVNHKELDPLNKSASRSAIAGAMRGTHTVPKPFSFATEKRALSGERQFVGNKSDKATDLQKKTQTNLPIATRKPLQPDNTMHSDGEDARSETSSTASSVRTSTTVAIAPVFRSSERATKRKEYYSKLEARQQSLDAEKRQLEARMKKEQDAALKQHRKSLVFKATPMPSFYHEGPPPAVELKKPPPTRATSFKLGRRKSLGDETNLSQEEKTSGSCGRLYRHSIGGDTSIAKSLSNTRKVPIKIKEGPKSARDGSKPVADEIPTEN